LGTLEYEEFQLIITDQMMPEMTGVEFLGKVNKKFPNIPPYRIILSGYGAPVDIIKAKKDLQLSQFIPKP
jgi:CheY-like chemotaxis protein